MCFHDGMIEPPQVVPLLLHAAQPRAVVELRRRPELCRVHTGSVAGSAATPAKGGRTKLTSFTGHNPIYNSTQFVLLKVLLAVDFSFFCCGLATRRTQARRSRTPSRTESSSPSSSTPRPCSRWTSRRSGTSICYIASFYGTTWCLTRNCLNLN